MNQNQESTQVSTTSQLPINQTTNPKSKKPLRLYVIKFAVKAKEVA
jgi:hypothetical protein